MIFCTLLPGCISEQVAINQNSNLFEIVQGEVYELQKNTGVITDKFTVKKLLAQITKRKNINKGSFCIVSPLLGQGGFSYSVQFSDSPTTAISVTLLKEDTFGASVLNHRIACFIANDQTDLPLIDLQPH